MIIVAGHLCLDVIPAFAGPARLDPGSLVRVGAATFSTGGVSNVGVALHRLGTPVKLIHKIGDDLFGQAVCLLLDAMSTQLASGVRTVPGETTSYSIVVAPPGVDRMFIHSPGANDTFDEQDVEQGALAGASHLHFGYPPIMRRIYSDGGASCRAIMDRAHAAGLTTSLDFCSVDASSDAGQVDWTRWLKAVLPAVDFFMPSLEEVSQSFGVPVSFEYESLVRVLNRLAEMGPSFVMLKLGDRGLIALDRSTGRIHTQPCFKVNVKSANGSGDCTIAGFLTARLLKRRSVEESLAFASATGACACEAADATGGVPQSEVVENRMSGEWDCLPGVSRR